MHDEGGMKLGSSGIGFRKGTTLSRGICIPEKEEENRIIEWAKERNVFTVF
jgi:hypothetical protein